MRLDLPGVSEDNLEIEFHEGHLSISGERIESTDEDDDRGTASNAVAVRFVGDSARRRGRGRGVEAEYTDGVLKIVAPKVEKARARRIALKS
ncbi:MAG: hypothetical protein CM1200mP2_19690 [Planctomycetaceae bacterium]|nr:MAG: hypothetical protein CM1200mP2_19690 [Planctomycetaceae bacterium]